MKRSMYERLLFNSQLSHILVRVSICSFICFQSVTLSVVKLRLSDLKFQGKIVVSIGVSFCQLLDFWYRLFHPLLGYKVKFVL